MNFSSDFIFSIDIEPDFKEQLKILVPLLLSPENLVVKQIGGNRIRAKELLHYFQSYMAIYKGDELPEPKSMLEVKFIYYLNLFFFIEKTSFENFFLGYC